MSTMSRENAIRYVPLVLVIVSGAGAFYKVQSDVAHNAAAIATKADKDLVESQYNSILRELQDIKDRLPK